MSEAKAVRPTVSPQNGMRIGSKMSKKEKKLERWHKIRQGKVTKRRLKKAVARSKGPCCDDNTSEKDSKKFRKRMEREKLLKVLNQHRQEECFVGLHVCLDLQYENLMTDKELGHLASQVRRLYGSNKAAENPALISLVDLKEEGRTLKLFQEKNDGFSNYLWHRSSNSLLEEFSAKDRLVYLSPDSPNVLEDLNPAKEIYVIGGLVDDSVKKCASKDFAVKHGVRSAKLPIDKFCSRNVTSSRKSATFKQILTVNQVFEILLKFYECQEWKRALEVGIPSRTGFSTV